MVAVLEGMKLRKPLNCAYVIRQLMSGNSDAVLKERINVIRTIIKSWEPLPEAPTDFLDSQSFSGNNPETKAFLIKIGEQIKIQTRKGDLDITFDDLIGATGRIGIGLDFLIMLENRLAPFKKLLDEAASRCPLGSDPL